jgi:hypothetical protein
VTTAIDGSRTEPDGAIAAHLTPHQKLALLMEWRNALVEIVEKDPDAVETRKAIVDIENQIAALDG